MRSEKLGTGKAESHIDSGKDIDPKKGDGTWEKPGEFPEFSDSEEEKTEPVNEQEENKEKSLDEEIAEIFAEANKVKTAEVPEGKFRIPDSCYARVMELTESARRAAHNPEVMKEFIKNAHMEVSKIAGLNGEVDADIGEKLWALYEDPEISLGIHGTIFEADSDFGTENSPVFRLGLGCGYYDLVRVAEFQDRDGPHAHGFISFVDLLEYSYGVGKEPLTVEKNVKHEEEIDSEGEGRKIVKVTYARERVPARRYGVVVAIPTNYDTADQELRGKEIEMKDNKAVSINKTKTGKVLKPEFVVGVVMDANPNTIVWNPEFDAEHVRELTRQREAENQAAKEAAEAERAQREANDSKGHRGGIFGRIFGKKNK